MLPATGVAPTGNPTGLKPVWFAGVDEAEDGRLETLGTPVSLSKWLGILLTNLDFTFGTGLIRLIWTFVGKSSEVKPPGGALTMKCSASKLAAAD